MIHEMIDTPMLLVAMYDVSPGMERMSESGLVYSGIEGLEFCRLLQNLFEFKLDRRN